MEGLKGFGLGLRPQHYQSILEERPPIDWFEVISENYMIGGGRPIANLLAICEHYPILLHGVSLSIGSTDPLRDEYLRDLKNLAEMLHTPIVSDHFCWTGVAGINTHDLLPMPFSEEALAHVSERIDKVQEKLGRQIALENTSTYVGFSQSTIPEWEFVTNVATKTGCKILLDVNNIYVNSINHGFEADRYVDHIPASMIAYVHLAGHENHGTYLIDTHDHSVAEPVWNLYRRLIERIGPQPTMIERDGNIPSFDELFEELGLARAISEMASKPKNIKQSFAP